MALQGPFFGKREEPTAPRTPGAEDLESIFVGSFRLW